MKRFSFVLLIFVSVTARSQPVYHYDVTKVMDGIYLLEPVINDYRWVTANVIVIVNDNDVMVVDSGLTPAAGAEAIKEIRRITSKPVKYLVNTHWHGDHWQGNEAFVAAYPGVEVVASAEGRNGIMRNGMLWVRQFYNKYLQLMIDDYEATIQKGITREGKKLSEPEMNTLKAGLADVKLDLAAIKSLKVTPPTLTFEKQMTITKGSREIQLHHLGWGNTTGDAIVYLPAEKLLITGDLVVSPSPYESASFSREWFETSKKLREFSFNYLLPGHGKLQTDASYLDYLNALFAEIIKQINAAFTQGKNTVEEASTAVTNDSVVAEMSKDDRYKKFLKDLAPSFVPACVKSALQKAREGKL